MDIKKLICALREWRERRLIWKLAARAFVHGDGIECAVHQVAVARRHLASLDLNAPDQTPDERPQE